MATRRLTTAVKSVVKTAEQSADSTTGRVLRAALAAVPVVGASASAWVESHLTAEQSKRTHELFNRILAIEGALTNISTRQDLSDALLEEAIRISAIMPDEWRRRAVANILMIPEKANTGEAIRRFLLDAIATLTAYEIALLVSLDGPFEERTVSRLTIALPSIDITDSTLDDIREFSLERLRLYRLIASTGASDIVTAMGRHLISVLS